MVTSPDLLWHLAGLIWRLGDLFEVAYLIQGVVDVLLFLIVVFRFVGHRHSLQDGGELFVILGQTRQLTLKGS